MQPDPIKLTAAHNALTDFQAECPPSCPCGRDLEVDGPVGVCWNCFDSVIEREYATRRLPEARQELARFDEARSVTLAEPWRSEARQMLEAEIARLESEVQS